ncbi:MAG: hypothetical protein H0W09_02550 [Solirubrobacterales bacterium]|nr:hypothetical protein [Solirubrobacterales bacterium]
MLIGAEVIDGGGEGHLEELVLRRSATGEEEVVAADGLFVLIGAHQSRRVRGGGRAR